MSLYALPEKRLFLMFTFLPNIFVAVIFAETNGYRHKRKVYSFSSVI